MWRRKCDRTQEVIKITATGLAYRSLGTVWASLEEIVGSSSLETWSCNISNITLQMGGHEKAASPPIHCMKVIDLILNIANMFSLPHMLVC